MDEVDNLTEADLDYLKIIIIMMMVIIPTVMKMVQMMMTLMKTFSFIVLVYWVILVFVIDFVSGNISSLRLSFP